MNSDPVNPFGSHRVATPAIVRSPAGAALALVLTSALAMGRSFVVPSRFGLRPRFGFRDWLGFRPWFGLHPRFGFRPSLLVLVLLCFAVGCQPSSSTADARKYHCPMHPTYVTDRPGDCPICNMKLVPIKDSAPAAVRTNDAQSTSRVAPGQYYCSMCPEVVTNAPGLCWVCNMKLKLKGEDAPHTGHDAAPTSGAGEPVPGRTAVLIAPEKQHLIGLRTAPVEQRHLVQTLRATAVVQHDETRYARVAPRFGGWIRKLHVNYTGQEVERGQPLLTVYSPELVATEREFLLARQQVEVSRTNSASREHQAAVRLLDAARERLALWEIAPEEITALEQRAEPSAELLIRAPVAGHVIAKSAVEGRSFMPGETLYELGVIDPLWLRVSLQETDFAQVQVGQPARALFPALGGRRYETTVRFMYPHLDPVTRRGEVRLELANPGRRLRPEMWADVEVDIDLGEVLVVPASAVIDTGQRCVAFVRGDDDHLHPREVQIGVRTDDWWQVNAGLEPGEPVVTRALFLVDSESQLKAAIATMTAK